MGCLQTQKPRRFDDELPDISVEDLQYLKSCCPVEVQPFLMYVPVLVRAHVLRLLLG